MRERMIGRADLLNALRLAEQEHDASPDHLAGLLGFRRNAAEIRPVPDSDNDDSRPDEALITARSTVTPTPTSERPPLSTSMWMLTELRRFDLHPPKDEETPEVNPGGQTAARPLRDEDGLPRCTEPLPAQHLVERHRLWPALRRSLSEERRHGVDLAALVRSLARAHLPPQLPQRRDRRWVNDILVVWDTSVRLTPYQADFEMIVSEVGARHGGVGLRLWRLHGEPEAGMDYAAVHPGGLVLVLSDLGNLAGDEGLRAGWRRVLHACRAQGARVVAWLPHGDRLVDREAAELGAMHCLVPRTVPRGPVRHGVTAAAIRGERQRLAVLREALLVRASVCIQLEVALLRRLRKTDAALQAEPGVEALAWNHQPVVRASLVSRALAPDYAAEYRKQFSSLPAEVQSEVLREVTEVHSREGRSTEMVETLIWQTYARPEATATQSTMVQAARQWCKNLAARLQRDAQQGEGPAADRMFAADLTARTAQDAEFVSSQSEWFDPVWAVSGHQKVPAGMSAERAFQARQRSKSLSSRPVTTYRPVLHEGGICMAEVPVPFTSLRCIGPAWSMSEAVVAESSGRTERLTLDRELVRMVSRAPAGRAVTLRCDLGLLAWTNLERPEWATEWGRDRFGCYADLTVVDIVQRLRYIEPGTFFMGSPESESGRAPDEGPTHLVTITQGFWLADTACTQAYWQSVTGHNPSQFKGDAGLPVDSVSWDDVQRFLTKLQNIIPSSCVVSLPTEAEWEYACRSKENTSEYYLHGLKDAIQVNFEGTNRKTVTVKNFPPNAWGLFQMSGNVSEWCLDRKRNYSRRNLINPDGGQSGEQRVVRGGSWDLPLNRTRPASRDVRKKSNRHKGIGFRFLIKTKN